MNINAANEAIVEITLSNGAVFRTVYRPECRPKHCDALIAAANAFLFEENIKDKNCSEAVWEEFWDDDFFSQFYLLMRSLKLVINGKVKKERTWIEADLLGNP